LYRNRGIGSPQEYIGETYQGIFAETRIATCGFAMATTGLALPGSSGMDVVERLACGICPDPRAGCSPIVTVETLSARRTIPWRFDHARSVNVPPRCALCGGRSLSQHCDHAPTASRASPFLTDTANSSDLWAAQRSVNTSRSQRGYRWRPTRITARMAALPAVLPDDTPPTDPLPPIELQAAQSGSDRTRRDILCADGARLGHRLKNAERIGNYAGRWIAPLLTSHPRALLCTERSVHNWRRQCRRYLLMSTSGFG
jgi:hypothetical protein